MSQVKTIWERLAEPFPAEFIHWRLGSVAKDRLRGMALAYIDARDLFDRLDQVVGPANWQSRVELGPDGRVIAGIGIRDIDGSGEWIWKWDGAGATNIEGEKGGISDALKRAGVQFQICRYLYRLDSPWVRVVARGRTFAIAAEEYNRLREYLEAGRMPDSPSESNNLESSDSREMPEDSSRRSRTPAPPVGDPDALATKEALKPYWKLNFQAVEAVYGKSKAEDHKFEGMDYCVARLGKNHTNQLRVGDLVKLPELLKEFVQTQGGRAEHGAPSSVPPEEDDGPPSLGDEDCPF